jgi:hypothetical protein
MAKLKEGVTLEGYVVAPRQHDGSMPPLFQAVGKEFGEPPRIFDYVTAWKVRDRQNAEVLRAHGVPKFYGVFLVTVEKEME